MTEMDGKSMDLKKDNIKKLKQLFPEIVTENKIDYEKFQMVLGEEVETQSERFNFTWAGKTEALKISQIPSQSTLLPCKQDSKEWNNTENLYIEGDNLEILKLLQKSYFEKIKVIYIDPPYNTGNDFVYKDNFKDSLDNYKKITGQIDTDGNMNTTNTESNGRYHSDWLNMMYPRLKLARNLLTDDGVIFISIDDNEQSNLKKMSDEIFGENNFVSTVIWQRAYSPVNLKKHFSVNHDYILAYAKNMSLLECNGLKRSEVANDRYANLDNDYRGKWTSSDLSVGPAIADKVYEIVTPSGRKILPPSGYCWRLSRNRFDDFVKDNRIWFGKSGNNTPRIKRFLNEVKDGITPLTIWEYKEVGHSQSAKQDLKKLFDGKSYFDYPKSVPLIKRILELYTKGDSIILDFFSGSATTAHSVMQLNTEDNGRRKFLMVQLPENLQEKSEAYQNGYKNICEIGKERIRRAGKMIEDEIKEKNSGDLFKEEFKKLDTGFKVFKLDTSNIKKWNPNLDKDDLDLIDNLNNIKPDRTKEDLLYEIIIKMGLELTYPIEEITIGENKIFSVAFGNLMICLDDVINIEVADEMVKQFNKLSPDTWKVVFFDNGFVSDNDKTNAKEILKCAGLSEENFTTI